MAKQYLKCNYYENSPIMTTSDEYLVTFKIKNMSKVNPSVLLGPKGKEKEFPLRDEEWCIVFREDVVSEGKNKGLVRLVNLKMNEKTDSALIGLRDSADKRISYFSVPMDEIVIQ